MKHVLFVLTSHARLGNTGKATGVFLEELAVPYWHLLDRGHAVRLRRDRRRRIADRSGLA